MAPIKWATCTANPEAAALSTPPKSHVVVDTRPMAAAGSLPKLPTMAASIYCITIDDSCAMIAGALSCAVSVSCWRQVMGLPSLMSCSKAFSVAIFGSGVPPMGTIYGAKLRNNCLTGKKKRLAP